MRLGQLARKLAIPPSEILDFLQAQGLPSLDGANARLSQDQLTAVLQRFAPGGLADEILNSDNQEEVVEAVVSSPVEVVAETPTVIEENIVAESPVVLQEPTSDEARNEASTSEKPEVIKAQKVALSGLKVLGKIELPEAKKKNPEVPDTTGEIKETPSPDSSRPAFEKRRPQQFKKDRREQRPAKNPVALAREREMKAAEEKKREDEKRRKEQRTANYQKRVKAAAPTKAARLLDEDTVHLSDTDMRPEPKTWLGKFWRWFTT